MGLPLPTLDVGQNEPEQCPPPLGESTLSSLIDTRSAMLTKLKESGLDDPDTIKKLRLMPKVNGEATDLVGFDTPGIHIPYFDINGKPTDFWRYRIIGKTKNKYMQAKGTGVAVYFPPFVKWSEVAADPSKPIIATEGEFKAACACKMGFTTLGLGGVWSFKSKAKDQELIPDLAQFEWTGRIVYICYDSDAATNEKVMQAENDLAKQLFNKGAKVFIVRLPKLPKLGKVGLDDYLMHQKSGGANRFRNLIKNAEEWSKSAALREFNKEVIFIFDPGVVVVKKTDQRLDPNKMVHVHYADRRYMKSTPTGKDPLKKTESSVPGDWLKWPGRHTADKQTYAPGQERITKDNAYNRWKGWGVPESKIKKGSVAPWTKLLDFLFKDARPSDRKWFEQWLAYPIQHPGVKMLTSAILWGQAHGTGKTLVGETLRRIYGDDNFSEIGDKHLESGFNDWAANKQFVTGSEITGSDKRAASNAIKNLITQTRIRINEKFIASYEVPDCVNYLWTANHSDAFYIEETDRRFFINHVKGDPLPVEFYTEVYDPWYKSEAGIGALFYHLRNLDTSDFHPNHPAPMTDAKNSVIDDSRSDMAQWVSELPSHPRMHKLMTSEELILMATGEGKVNWTKNGLTRAMKQARYSRPLGDSNLLVLDDGKRVKPWLVDKDAMPKKPSQSSMRDLWYSDRTATARQKKFIAK